MSLFETHLRCTANPAHKVMFCLADLTVEYLKTTNPEALEALKICPFCGAVMEPTTECKIKNVDEILKRGK